MKHKHYDMIVAKVANMELVGFYLCGATNKWIQSAMEVMQYKQDVDYFLCLPQHKEACLHWLNGGDAEFSHDGVGFGVLRDPRKWVLDHAFMCENLHSRIKPRKEKRWIAIYSDGTVCDRNKRTIDEIKTYVERTPFYSNCAPDNWQFIEIEVEVA